jgi:hypothetical protein
MFAIAEIVDPNAWPGQKQKPVISQQILRYVLPLQFSLRHTVGVFHFLHPNDSVGIFIHFKVCIEKGYRQMQ